MVAFDQEVYLKNFYQALMERALEPDDPRYVHLYEDGELAAADPIAALATTIEWAPRDSKQLFSGARGTGKSTELRRLRRRLMSRGNVVVALCDMADYLDPYTPVDISDFLICVAGAFSDALEADEALLGKVMLQESYWTRFQSFVSRMRIELPALSADTSAEEASVGLAANLKHDPAFRQQIQQQMKGHLAALSSDVHAFMAQCLQTLQKRHGDDVQVVILFDSIERIRGTSINAQEVAASVATLFEGHADELGFPSMHVVYTVPPWLALETPDAASLYDSGQQIPCIEVCDAEGVPRQAGLDALARLVGKRGDWSILLGDRATLDDLCLASGGYLRDLFRLLQALLRHARGRSLPVDADAIELVKHAIRDSYLPMSNQDAMWLDRIRRSRAAHLEDGKRLHELARFFDTHRVLAYGNGQAWWSVHPLLAEQVERQAAAQQRAGDAPAR